MWKLQERLTIGGYARHGGSGGGSGGGSTNTVQKSDPWAGQQPYLTDVFQKAQTNYGAQPMSYYPGQTYADLSPETNLALNLQTQRALGGSDLERASQAELTKTMRGDYLDPTKNPFLLAGGDAIRAQVQPQIDARFAASGRTGSGLASRALGTGITEALSNAALQNYGMERENQMRGMLFAPQMADRDFANYARLAEVGGVKEDYAQQGINDAVNRFNFQQQEPWQRLGLYSNLVQGHYGSTTEGMQTMPRRSVGAGLLGGAATGGGLGYLFSGGNPYASGGGAAIGAALGGLF